MKIGLIVALFLLPAPVYACLKDCVPDNRLYRLTRNYEGLRLYAYKDIAGHETIGFGHLIKPEENFPRQITGTQAEVLLEEDEVIFVRGVNNIVDIDMRVNQFDSLVDFSFNLGISTLERSLLLTLLNKKELTEVPTQFLRYDKARIGGVLETVSGLLSRRRAESSLFKETN